MISLRLLNISRSGALNQAVLLIKNRSVPWGLIEGGQVPGGAIRAREEQEALMRVCRRGAHILKRLMYAIPLSVIAVLVFAALAVAQDVQKGQQDGQEPSQNPATGHTTDVQNSTTLPAKNEPAETKEPAETTTPAKSTAPATDTTVAVDINDLGFAPPQLNIAPGTRVMFVNNGTKAHTATADNELFDTGALERGESTWVYFRGPGTVTYHDELHP